MVYRDHVRALSAARECVAVAVRRTILMLCAMVVKIIRGILATLTIRWLGGL